MTNRETIEKDKKYIWHPFTQHKDYEKKNHIVIEKGEGVYLFDDKNQKYFDTISSWWVNLHGHNNPRIKKAINDQMNKIEHVNFSGFTHKPAVQLAEMIVETMPKDLTKVFYSDNGSTAVEVALKMSYQYWKNKGILKKNKFIYLDNGYHGDTVGAVSVGGVDTFHNVYKPLLFTAHKIESPNCLNCRYGKNELICETQCLDSLRKLVENEKGEISGFIMEPMIQAAGGLIFNSKKYLQEVRKITKENEIHFIADEVATGFGRTGKMWAVDHAGITPDFMCISKGISAGYLPLAATITTLEIFERFYDEFNRNKTFFHGHSYTANPLACAAGVESLLIFKDDDVIKRTELKSEHLKEEMKKFKKFANVKNIRVLGMVAAMDVVSDKEGLVFDKNIRIGELIYEEGFKQGLVLRPIGDIIYYFLPHSIMVEEIDEIVNRTQKVLEKVLKSKL